MAILIEDGVVSRIAPASREIADEGLMVIDGQGRIAMPGLVDMHVHIWDEASLGAYLANGVTTVRNASGMPFHLPLADRIENGEVLGPRLITTGPILNSHGANEQINHEIVATAEEARGAVRRQYDAGFRRLKVYSNLTREAYDAIRDEAGKLGMTVMGHTPEGVRMAGTPAARPFTIGFDEILDDGFVTIEHVESIVWHGLRNRYDESVAKTLAAKIADANVPVDPTLLAFSNLLRVAETRGKYLQRPGTEMLNPLLVAQSQAEYDRWSHEDIPQNRAAFEFFKTMTQYLHEEGALMVAGSDAGIFTNIPGVSLVEELDLLVEAGLQPQDALRAATLNPAKVLGETDRFGRVAEGQRADLLLLDADPSMDLSALRRLSAVIAKGRYLDREKLDDLSKSAAVHDVARTQRNLAEALEAQGVDIAGLGL
ncbi:amidohydrolase family protein [Qipengyuania soli]|uniref:Amidohydrolase family protein n=1 Tax=Qipengyuania soli TaxID=2782568 RepID=A0A7S8F3N3_9SPHN|nr:amidohydrolase family protein [Qipengyuania soli]QPC98531.1 amidohydrolase family protein [Qipengyuania soli]